MEREFEKYLGGPTQSTSDRMHITINANNVIGFNNNLYRLLGKPPAVYLHFSRVRDIIVIEPVSSLRLPTAFPVKQKTSVGWRINAAPFCKHFNIRIDSTERFISPDLRDDGSLHLKLSETVTIRQIRRKKRQ
ncbi:MAG: hypothetical protein WKF92_15990 [Pyrinomonadaceae bacterium]